MEKSSITKKAPYQVSPQQYSVGHHMVTTAFELPGFRVIRNLGVVRGITVRSRSVFGTIGASFQTLVGGNISIFTQLCEHARYEAFEIMIQHASEIGANAIIGARYDANEVMGGVTEVLAYGTAVVVEPLDTSDYRKD
ncbi:MAG: YbjQ family protein [Acidobacteriota bacterium]|nr:MAG: YbjQ family protein [Acidobacteriota bacterium]